jgi:F420-dependent oxidoreductase-like protein
MADVRFGLKLSQHAPIEDYRYAWQVADDAGFEHCWVMDHFATIGGAEDGDIFEAWTMQAAMAVATTRTRVGCMVTGNTYRHPGVLAKMAVTVDHLSGGRLEFGIGAGWAEFEHTMFRLELGRPGERLDRLEEACRIVRSLWTEPRTTFAGRYYTITDAVAEPKPVQERVPLWIGGSGRRRTLRIVAQYADAWNAVADTAAAFGELSEVLDAHCAEVGRDPQEVRRTVQLRLRPTDDDSIRMIEEYVRAGADDVIIMAIAPDARAGADRAAGLLGRLRNLG